MTLHLGHDREKGLRQTEEVAVAEKVSEPPKMCVPLPQCLRRDYISQPPLHGLVHKSRPFCPSLLHLHIGCGCQRISDLLLRNKSPPKSWPLKIAATYYLTYLSRVRIPAQLDGVVPPQAVCLSRFRSSD